MPPSPTQWASPQTTSRPGRTGLPRPRPQRPPGRRPATRFSPPALAANGAWTAPRALPIESAPTPPKRTHSPPLRIELGVANQPRRAPMPQAPLVLLRRADRGPSCGRELLGCCAAHPGTTGNSRKRATAALARGRGVRPGPTSSQGRGARSLVRKRQCRGGAGCASPAFVRMCAFTRCLPACLPACLR
jgi:hypothetical protein